MFILLKLSMVLAKSTEELDAQLLSTLREIDPYNYAYLFERCKRKYNYNCLVFQKKKKTRTITKFL